MRRRRWLDRRRFLDLLAATSLIPGPNSTEMAIHLGYVRAGWPGLVAGGACFILPAAVLAAILAWGYGRVGHLPLIGTLLGATRPAVLVVVADALVGFARQSVRGPGSALIAVASLALALDGVSEVGLVFAAAAVGAVAALRARARLHAVPLLQLAVVFGKIGATLFGSGYVLIAYLRAEIVARGWLGDAQLLDAVVIGQVTPGPVSAAATFIGYLIDGFPGAAVATVAVFLPGFVLVAATGPFLEGWQRRPAVRRALDAVNAAVVGLIAAVMIGLTPAALAGRFEAAVLAAAAIGVWGFRLPGWAVLSGAALLGLARGLAG